jgi:hypothetical protein
MENNVCENCKIPRMAELKKLSYEIVDLKILLSHITSGKTNKYFTICSDMQKCLDNHISSDIYLRLLDDRDKLLDEIKNDIQNNKK